MSNIRVGNNMTAHRSLSVLAIVAQLVVGYCTWWTYWIFTRHWQEILPGKPLAEITELSLVALRWVPLVFSVALLFGFYKTPIWIAYILLTELVILSVLILGVGLPAATIMYRLSNTPLTP